ncbi:MAG: carbohydrate-binding domain-containing protein [Oscillospiraceae bacterium]|nr:carbohydrate-binding domain-containing protein [Oscillospiraceae bacterium]
MKRVLCLLLAAALALFFTGCGYVNENKNKKDDGGTAQVSGADTYKLSFYSDGNLYSSADYETGASVTVPAEPVKEGYTFVSWDNSVPSSMPEENISFNAVYKINKYTLTYVMDGQAVKNAEYEYGAAIESYSPDYNSEEYQFSGWADLPASMPSSDTTVTGKLYNLGEIINIDLSSLKAGSVYNISKSGIYMASGTAANAQLLLSGKGCDFTLIFSDASMTYLGAGAPVQCDKGNSLNIILTDGTENFVSDSSSNTEDAAIQVKSADLSISGGGKLTVNSSSEGIYNTKNFTVSGGDITVNSADHGVAVKNSLTIKSGKLTVKAGGDGIKAKGDTDENGLYISGSGIISLLGGTIDLTSSGDGIDAESSILVGGGKLNISSGLDGIKAVCGVTICGGEINIVSKEDGIKANGDGTAATGYVKLSGGTTIITSAGDGIQAETFLTVDSPAAITITSGGGINGETTYDSNNEEISCNGLKGKLSLVINGGYISIDSRETALKSDAVIEINGGSVDIKSASTAVKSENDEETAGKLSISGGTTTISAGKNGLFSIDTLSISGGNVNIKTTGTEIKSQTSTTKIGGRGFGPDDNNTVKIASKGIKSNSDIDISGGTITVSSTGHAIKSGGTLTVKGNAVLNLDAYYNNANSKGLASDGVLTIDGGKIAITRSYEGIESKTYININGGYIELAASDDGLNAGGTGASNTGINITGGYLFVNASGDGIDSNGNIIMSGGNVIAAGPTSDGNGPLDCGDGSCYIKITGGVLLAYGSSGMAEYPSSNYSTQYSIGTALSLSAGTLWSIADSDGNVLFTFKALKMTQSVCLSIPEFEKNAVYTISTGGSYTGGTCVNEVYSGGSYSGGSVSSKLTLTAVTTSTGGGGMNPGRPGGGMNPGGPGGGRP